MTARARNTKVDIISSFTLKHALSVVQPRGLFFFQSPLCGFLWRSLPCFPRITVYIFRKCSTSRCNIFTLYSNPLVSRPSHGKNISSLTPRVATCWAEVSLVPVFWAKVVLQSVTERLKCSLLSDWMYEYSEWDLTWKSCCSVEWAGSWKTTPPITCLSLLVKLLTAHTLQCSSAHRRSRFLLEKLHFYIHNQEYSASYKFQAEPAFCLTLIYYQGAAFVFRSFYLPHLEVKPGDTTHSIQHAF